MSKHRKHSISNGKVNGPPFKNNGNSMGAGQAGVLGGLGANLFGGLNSMLGQGGNLMNLINNIDVEKVMSLINAFSGNKGTPAKPIQKRNTPNQGVNNNANMNNLKNNFNNGNNNTYTSSPGTEVLESFFDDSNENLSDSAFMGGFVMTDPETLFKLLEPVLNKERAKTLQQALQMYLEKGSNNDEQED